MDYHQPDKTWAAIGYLDYESYSKTMVITGKFHPNVPDDVVKAYTLVEYIMAHAYYHYPLYDEAFSKLLRIIEMATKLRCNQLGISVESENSKKEVIKKTLHSLIQELSEKEPDKDISEKLHRLRKIRNKFMHPDNHSFAPTLLPNIIKLGVVLLNKLFIDNDTLKRNESFRSELENKMNRLKEKRMCLHLNEKVYPIIAMEVASAAYVNDTWTYCIIWLPIMSNISEQMKEHNYAAIVTIHINNIRFTDTSMKAYDTDRERDIYISPYSDKIFGDLYVKYENDVNSAHNTDKKLFYFHNATESWRITTDFEYKYLHVG